MAQDRDYWRAVSDIRLIEEARDSGDELSIALGERLQDTLRDCERLGGRESHDRRENENLLATIMVMRAEIKALEDQVSDLLGLGD
jgi:hypothetical protein